MTLSLAATGCTAGPEGSASAGQEEGAVVIADDEPDHLTPAGPGYGAYDELHGVRPERVGQQRGAHEAHDHRLTVRLGPRALTAR
ncbi:MAG: hypothetical protein ACRDMV_10955 [Streptosporangiales bacterium]